MKKFNPNVTTLLVRQLSEVVFLISYTLLLSDCAVRNVRAFEPMPLLFVNDASTASCCYISLNCHVHSWPWHCFHFAVVIAFDTFVIKSEIMSPVKQFDPFF